MRIGGSPAKTLVALASLGLSQVLLAACSAADLTDSPESVAGPGTGGTGGSSDSGGASMHENHGAGGAPPIASGGSGGSVDGVGGLPTGGSNGTSGGGTGGSGGQVPGCTAFGPGVSQGASQVGNEISGVVASRQHEDVLWVHNDSGDSAKIYAMDSQGTYLATVELDGVQARDFEDIAIDPNHRIYVGDIGDNASERSSVQIYRFAEPTHLDSAAIHVTSEVITLHYPGGATDAETLAIDPLTGDLFLLTKTYGTDTLYRAAAPIEPGDITLSSVATAHFGGDGSTAGDISPDGRFLMIRTYGGLFAWKREPGTTIAEAMSGERLTWSVQGEPQGEAVAFSADGEGYFTISEGASQPVYFYPCAP